MTTETNIRSYAWVTTKPPQPLNSTLLGLISPEFDDLADALRWAIENDVNIESGYPCLAKVHEERWESASGLIGVNMNGGITTTSVDAAEYHDLLCDVRDEYAT